MTESSPVRSTTGRLCVCQASLGAVALMGSMSCVARAWTAETWGAGDCHEQARYGEQRIFSFFFSLFSGGRGGWNLPCPDCRGKEGLSEVVEPNLGCSRPACVLAGAMLEWRLFRGTYGPAIAELGRCDCGLSLSELMSAECLLGCWADGSRIGADRSSRMIRREGEEGRRKRKGILTVARKWLPGERRLFCCDKIPCNSR